MINMGKKREIKLTDLSEDAIRIADEVIKLDGCLNFMWELWFDVDKYFGTNINETGNWFNFYTDWDEKTDSVDCYVETDTPNGDKEPFDWTLTEEEKALFYRKMEQIAKDEGYTSLKKMYDDYCEF